MKGGRAKVLHSDTDSSIIRRAAIGIETASRAIWSEEGMNRKYHQPTERNAEGGLFPQENWASAIGSLAAYYRRRCTLSGV
jgi:hypothetical protein